MSQSNKPLSDFITTSLRSEFFENKFSPRNLNPLDYLFNSISSGIIKTSTRAQKILQKAETAKLQSEQLTSICDALIEVCGIIKLQNKQSEILKDILLVSVETSNNIRKILETFTAPTSSTAAPFSTLAPRWAKFP